MMLQCCFKFDDILACCKNLNTVRVADVEVILQYFGERYFSPNFRVKGLVAHDSIKVD